MSPPLLPIQNDSLHSPGRRQVIVINLVLEDDSALGNVVGALATKGSHILGLRKSEPTLEDVFVELVGRGFEEADDRNGHAPVPDGPLTRETAPQSHEVGEPSEEEVA